jgi:hypothetical protein
VRRAPGGPTGVAAIRPPPTRVQATRGRLARVERRFTCAAQVTHGFVGERWDIDRRAIPRAHQPRPWDRVPTVGCHAVTGRVGKACGGDDPAEMAVFRQIARAPVAPGSRFIDEAQVCGVGLQLAHELSNGAWPSATGPTGDDFSVVIVGDRGHGHGVLVDIQPHVAWARVRHG